MATSAELLQSVKSAVRRTVAAIQVQRPEESLAGYALLTDDSLTTLTYMAVTKEALVLGGGDDLLFSPTDWPIEYESASFDVANQQLRAMEAGGDTQTHVPLAYASLVQALAEARAEGLFSPEVFLSVLSTDPGPQLERLERSSVERLNRMDLVEARSRFLEKWAG
jgi:hypothetical protein